MAPNKKSKPNKSAKIKSKVLCEICGKHFSKASNLSTHIEKSHKGLRWRCHICSKRQVSKHSHLRHYKYQHNNELPANIDGNQRYADSTIDMPSKAKDSVIQSLKEQIDVQKVMLVSFRERLLTRLEQVIQLKGELKLDCESEKLEYNTLLGTGEESDDSVDAENADKLSPENESDPLAESNVDDSDCEKFVEEQSIHESDKNDEREKVNQGNDGDDDDDDDDNCNQSSYYPDKYPVILEPIANDPDAGGSSV